MEPRDTVTTAPNEPLAVGAKDPLPWWGMGEVVHLAVPSVLNTVSFALMQFVDGWMVSMVSKEALSAQFIGGMTLFAPLCFFMGVLSCVSTFAAQNLGAGRREQAARYGWQGLWLAWAAAVGLALLVLPAPYLLGLFGHEENVTRLEVQYFRILIAGGGFALSATALGSFFLGIHRPMITFVAGIAGNVVNVAAAYVLIFGKLGCPALGLAGAALGTVAGAAVQGLVLFGYFVAGPEAGPFQVLRQWGFTRSAMKDLLRVGSPAGAMFMADVLMWALFMGKVVGSFGTEHLAAAAILNRYWHLCFMPAIGVSAAVTAIVGRHCGAGRQDLAWRRAHAGLVLVEVYMVTSGALIWFARDPLVGVFNDSGDPAVQSIATSAVIFILICQAFDALNVIFIGALRGAGDTLVPGVIQISLAYVVGVGGSALVAHLRPDWGSLGPWGAASGYIILLGLVMWGRFLGGRWRSIRVVEPAPAPVLEETAGLPPA
jgi:MATE family multidrug resistance protein